MRVQFVLADLNQTETKIENSTKNQRKIVIGVLFDGVLHAHDKDNICFIFVFRCYVERFFRFSLRILLFI